MSRRGSSSTFRIALKTESDKWPTFGDPEGPLGGASKTSQFIDPVRNDTRVRTAPRVYPAKGVNQRV